MVNCPPAGSEHHDQDTRGDGDPVEDCDAYPIRSRKSAGDNIGIPRKLFRGRRCFLSPVTMTSALPATAHARTLESSGSGGNSIPWGSHSTRVQRERSSFENLRTSASLQRNFRRITFATSERISSDDRITMAPAR